MIGYYLGMHQTGVPLDPRLLACRAGAMRRLVLLLVLVIVTRAIGVNRPYLSRNVNQQRDRARDYDCNVFSHLRLVVGQALGLPARKHGNRSGCPTSSTRLRPALGDERRSVNEKALLQNQFSERKCAGRSGIEQQRRNETRGECTTNALA